MKAYMLRHQHAGVITSHVFLEEPDEAQIAPLLEAANRVHGEGWHRVQEVEVVHEDDVPQLDTPSYDSDRSSRAAPPEFVIAASGKVG